MLVNICNNIDHNEHGSIFVELYMQTKTRTNLLQLYETKLTILHYGVDG